VHRRKKTPEQIVKGEVLAWFDLVFPRMVIWVNSNTGVFDPKTRGFRKRTGRYYPNGISDLLGVLPDGRFLAIELKAGKSSRATKEQIVFIDRINNAGGLAFVARSSDDCEKFMAEYLVPNTSGSGASCPGDCA